MSRPIGQKTHPREQACKVAYNLPQAAALGPCRSVYDWSRGLTFMAEKDGREWQRLRFATECWPISEAN